MQGLFWNPFERQIPKLSLESQFEQNSKETHRCCKVFQHYCNWYECMCVVFVCIHVTSCRTNVPGLSTVAQWESAIGMGGHKNEHFSNYFTFLEKPCFINIIQQTFILLRIICSTLNIGSTHGRPNSHCALVPSLTTFLLPRRGPASAGQQQPAQVDENLNSLVPETDEQEISCVSPLTLITSCSSPSISTSPPPLPPSPDMDIIKVRTHLC